MKKPVLRQLHEYNDESISNLLENYRRLGYLADPDYCRLLAELERRKGKGLDFEKTLAAIRKAAAEGRYLTYQGVAEASSVDFNKVHFGIGQHLARLCEYCHRHGWPLISAVVVNKAGAKSGALSAYSLGGFIEVARSLGYAVTDQEAFLCDQQERTFAWAKQPLVRPS